MTEPMTIFAAICLSLIILFALALFFALALCRVAADADALAARLKAERDRAVIIPCPGVPSN